MPDIKLYRATCRLCGETIYRYTEWAPGRQWRLENASPTNSWICPGASDLYLSRHQPMRVRVSDRVQNHLAGGEVWQRLRSRRPQREGEPAEDVSMMETIRTAESRRDGSVHVYLTRPEIEGLLVYAEGMQAAAQGDAGWDKSALADYNAATALVRQIRKELDR
jgi:hypothetical protein